MFSGGILTFILIVEKVTCICSLHNKSRPNKGKGHANTYKNWCVKTFPSISQSMGCKKGLKVCFPVTLMIRSFTLLKGPLQFITTKRVALVSRRKLIISPPSFSGTRFAGETGDSSPGSHQLESSSIIKAHSLSLLPACIFPLSGHSLFQCPSFLQSAH